MTDGCLRYQKLTKGRGRLHDSLLYLLLTGDVLERVGRDEAGVQVSKLWRPTAVLYFQPSIPLVILFLLPTEQTASKRELKHGTSQMPLSML